MQKLEAILYRCCAYTVAITLAFFTLASAFGADVSLNFFNFFICLLIGTALAISTLIFKIKTLSAWIKVLLHFAILLAIYCPFLSISIPEFMERQAAIFIALMLFIIAYAIGFAIVIALKKLLGKTAKNATKEPTSYKPRYK